MVICSIYNEYVVLKDVEYQDQLLHTGEEKNPQQFFLKTQVKGEGALSGSVDARAVGRGEVLVRGVADMFAWRWLRNINCCTHATYEAEIGQTAGHA